MISKKTSKRLRIKKGIRKKINGTAQLPRLSVFKSNKNIYAQLIDDQAGKTLVSSSSHHIKLKGKKNIETSEKVGRDIGVKAKGKNIKKIVFDRGGWPYHGKLRALAEGAREEGLIF